MKKIILLFAVVLTAIRCGGPDPEKIYYNSRWTVKNSTKQTLMIAPAPRGETEPFTLAAGEEVDFYSRGEYIYYPYFQMIMVCWRGVPEEEIYFDISDADGNLLKRWQWENRGYYSSLSDTNFFSESSWTHSSNHDKRKEKKDHWSFEILPEAIR